MPRRSPLRASPGSGPDSRRVGSATGYPLGRAAGGPDRQGGSTGAAGAGCCRTPGSHQDVSRCATGRTPGCRGAPGCRGMPRRIPRRAAGCRDAPRGARTPPAGRPDRTSCNRPVGTAGAEPTGRPLAGDHSAPVSFAAPSDRQLGAPISGDGASCRSLHVPCRLPRLPAPRRPLSARHWSLSPWSLAQPRRTPAARAAGRVSVLLARPACRDHSSTWSNVAKLPRSRRTSGSRRRYGLSSTRSWWTPVVGRSLNAATTTPSTPQWGR